MDAVGKNNSKLFNVLDRIWNGPSDETENPALSMPIDNNKTVSSEAGDHVSKFKIEVKSDEPDPEEAENMKPDIYPIKPDVFPVTSDFQPVNLNNNSTDKSPAAQTTLISRGTTITGDITSDCNLEICGTVKGTVSTTGNVKMSGKQVGDVSGSSLTLEACTVRGNLTVSEDITIDSDSVIIGDVKTKNLIIDGKLQGNVHAKNNITCQSNSVIIGDLVGASISVKDGAKLQGKMQIFNGQLGEIKITDDTKILPAKE